MKTAQTAQHTPGPWEAYNADGNGRILKHWRIRGACVRDDPTFAIIDSDGKILPEYEAGNAALIAAAPELLAALETAIKILHPGAIGLIEHHHGKDRSDDAASFVWAARAAIAKAKGESNV